MKKSNDDMAWYNALPKEKQRFLDFLESNDIHWNGPAGDDEPLSVELEGYTNGGEDMIITLDCVSAEDLQEYVRNFDIDAAVDLWWNNGQPGRGVPFDSQAEHAKDYEEWLARLQDIIDEYVDNGHDNSLTNVQELAAKRFREAVEELRMLNVGIRYDAEKDEFTLYRKAA